MELRKLKMKELIGFFADRLLTIFRIVNLYVIISAVFFFRRLHAYKKKKRWEEIIYSEALENNDYLDALGVLNDEFPTPEELLICHQYAKGKRSFLEKLYPVDNVPIALTRIFLPYFLLAPIAIVSVILRPFVHNNVFLMVFLAFFIIYFLKKVR